MQKLKFTSQSSRAILTASALMLNASLAIFNPAHATEHGKAPKTSAKSSAVAQQPSTASKPITATNPEIDFRGVLLGVPGQVSALKELCLRGSNAGVVEAEKHVEDPSIDLGKLTYKQMSEPQVRLSTARRHLKYCENEIKPGAEGRLDWNVFPMEYANLKTMFTLKSSNDGAILQLTGHIHNDQLAALLILLGERFGSPQAKKITYQNRIGTRFDMDSFSWIDSKSNAIEVIPNERLSNYLLVFKAGTVAQKRADEVLESMSNGRSKM
jgi:hypothetical protein